jgi:hypothetical protein
MTCTAALQCPVSQFSLGTERTPPDISDLRLAGVRHRRDVPRQRLGAGGRGQLPAVDRRLGPGQKILDQASTILGNNFTRGEWTAVPLAFDCLHVIDGYGRPGPPPTVAALRSGTGPPVTAQHAEHGRATHLEQEGNKERYAPGIGSPDNARSAAAMIGLASAASSASTGSRWPGRHSSHASTTWTSAAISGGLPSVHHSPQSALARW